jgi:multisubunit Na+/H+ antiporter MnhC subunit
MTASLAVPTTTWYLVLASVLFGIGTVGVLVRRNPLIMLMCVELMLNAVNLSFVAVAKKLGGRGRPRHHRRDPAPQTERQCGRSRGTEGLTRCSMSSG